MPARSSSPASRSTWRSSLNATLAGFEPAASAAGVRLEADLAPDLPVLEIDPVRIRSVVANLLANAIRHTPPGGRVTVSGRAAGDVVEVAVTDTGSGIPRTCCPTSSTGS